jgi:hypothetical protein
VCLGARSAARVGPKITVAVVVATVVWRAAWARIYAAEATGLANSTINPDTSQAIPRRSGAVGTVVRVVRVNGCDQTRGLDRHRPRPVRPDSPEASRDGVGGIGRGVQGDLGQDESLDHRAQP